jgi:pyruvate/2-oxoglutarate dehydrogenase complex dihydrolipoamide dehydrogenase (E3) component
MAAAEHAQAMRDGIPFGIVAEDPKVNFRRVHDHIEQVIAALAPESSAARLGAQGIDVVTGTARFMTRKAVAVGDTEIRAHRFVIATGARPTIPAIPGLDAVPYFTVETILDNTRKLTHLVVIGGNSAGIELAQAYNRLGTEVTVIENGPMLPGVDPELAAVALRRVEEEGVKLLSDTAVTAIQARSMGTGVAIRSGDIDRVLDASHILVSTDRVPNLDGLDLDKAGIKRAKADPLRLQLTPGLRTSNARVYAVGEVAGGLSVPAVARQAETVVRNALLGLAARPDPHGIPRLVSTEPAIAEVGLSEAAARTRYGASFQVTRWAFADNDQARAARKTLGAAKLITDRSGVIVGAGIVGPGASELVSLFALAMAGRLKAGKLADLAAPYPSYAEIAVRLGQEFRRGEAQSPLTRRWIALNRLLG